MFTVQDQNVETPQQLIAELISEKVSFLMKRLQLNSQSSEDKEIALSVFYFLTKNFDFENWHQSQFPNQRAQIDRSAIETRFGDRLWNDFMTQRPYYHRLRFFLSQVEYLIEKFNILQTNKNSLPQSIDNYYKMKWDRTSINDLTVPLFEIMRLMTTIQFDVRNAQGQVIGQ